MKNAVLDELKKNKGKYISGEELSKKIGVSRTSVWKYINKLKEEGYVIESSTNKGYVLIESPDALYPNEIKGLMNTKLIGKEIVFLESVDSTNNYAKKMGEGEFQEGTLIIAEEQTAGRGRLGREWISPKGKGIWMTIMLKPDIKPEQAAQITLIAAFAVVLGIKNICNIDAMIKWPNDVVVNGKKLCGILTEMGAEIDRINYLIAGIGINANIDEKDFADSGLNIATSIKIQKGRDIDRKLLISDIIKNFEELYINFIEKGSIEYIIKDYKKVSATLGKDVRILAKDEEWHGLALDINNQGHLIVKMDDGTIKEISSGEVSVRGIYEYA